ncbi:Proto-oncogene tyrosine-protein kinase LCK [Monoraphidium neglectum]|uniref:Proto-oncogene tyrosine-protein kinase LCK n=1 Tax=Monoraphidium neglectum TaxID=145388 RepID=A0A0D2LL12_9CHLO|nr:Proto-oncogene tyrosine-protein kinase LCK [Monoraphidium neglectum]KIZ07069.1 Proto-oncogene tyrosine-protein kinase LCK [Monoraphidium neglectum]|eukprot:XP_013906088.1 Proto-oncogene tyrosine-protein kinase LCK [Monoraphidium neglectum]
MGACVSKTPQEQQGSGNVISQHGSSDKSQPAVAGKLAETNGTCEKDVPADSFKLMNGLLLEMNTITGAAPGLVLPELAECIVDHLPGVDMCSITAVIEPEDGPPAVGVLLAAHGVGASVAGDKPVMHARSGGSGAGGVEACWSVLRVHQGCGPKVLRWCAPADGRQQSPLASGRVCAQAPMPASELAPSAPPLPPQPPPPPPPPRDFHALSERAALKDFLAAPISAGGRVLGSLTVASTRRGAFDGWAWEPTVTMAATGLLPHLLNPQVGDGTAMLNPLWRLHTAPPQLVNLCKLLVRGLSRFMAQVTNMRMALRLGLIGGDRMLLVENEAARRQQGPAQQQQPSEEIAGGGLGAAGRRRGSSSFTSGGTTLSSGVSADSAGASAGASGAPGASPARRTVVTELPLAHTLLGSAAAAHTARFISDCALYFQVQCGAVQCSVGAPHPACDVFTPASRVVAALVVVPLIRGSAAFGGLYFALDAPNACGQLQGPILAATSLVSMLLASKLDRMFGALRARAPADSAWSLSSSGRQGSGSAAAAGAGAGGSARKSGSGRGTAAAAGDAMIVCGEGSGDAGEAVGGGGGAWGGADVSGGSFNSGPVCTEAILKVVQQKLSASHSVCSAAADCETAPARRLEGLSLKAVIGRGGYGVCYRGIYRGTPVAVKVLYASDQRSAMKDAMEMAVLSHVRHPGIVTVYDCLTDVVEVRQESGSAALPHYRAAQPGEDPGLAVCNMIIMELCDLGTLREAIKRGVLHQRVSQSMAAVDLDKVVRVLLEVSRSVEHMHERKLLHCDIKMDNILLKSDPTRDLGFCCKLADFGLAKMLNEECYVNNRSGSGTITHVAPEMLLPNTKLTTAVDAHAFGILMYEVYTGKRVYAGLTRGQILDQGARPSFPATAPHTLAALASLCCAQEPSLRPSFETISSVLEEMLPPSTG